MPKPTPEEERVAVLHQRVDQIDAQQSATERIVILIALVIGLQAVASVASRWFGTHA